MAFTSGTLNLFLQSPVVPYIQTSGSFIATTGSVWHEIDLSSIGIPANCVAEIVIANQDIGDERFVGVREVGSSLDRRLLPIEAEDGGFSTAIMHVNVDSSSKIEVFVGTAVGTLAEIIFNVVGYWVDGIYVEMEPTTSFENTLTDTWEDIDISSFGIPNNSIAEVSLSNEMIGSRTNMGIRKDGSLLDRIFDIMEGEDGGQSLVTTFIDVGDGTVECYSEDPGVTKFYFLGYWSEKPLDRYIEMAHNFSGSLVANSLDNVWIGVDLSDESIFPEPLEVEAVLEVALGNAKTADEQFMGIRSSGINLDRRIELREAEGLGNQWLREHTVLDQNNALETYIEDHLGSFTYFLPGVWSDTPQASGQINLFTEGEGLSSHSGQLDLYLLNFDTVQSGIDLYTNSHEVSSGNLDLFTIGVSPQSGSLNLFIGESIFSISGNMTLFISGPMDIAEEDITLFIEGSDNKYIQTSGSFSATSSGVWHEFDLSTFNVPTGVVAEIAIGNTSLTNERYGGVRAVGSSIDRRFQLAEAETGGANFAVMHVQVNSNIEIYAETISDISFDLVGYWTAGEYTEVSGAFQTTTDGQWENVDLSSFGIPDDSIIDILMANEHTFQEKEMGIRRQGSNIDRKFNLTEAESNGIETLCISVNIGTGVIQAYSEDISDTSFNLLGYWSVRPVETHIELASDFSSYINTDDPDFIFDNAWIGVPLSGAAILPLQTPSSAILEVILGNDQDTQRQFMGIRTSGTNVDRRLELREAEDGGDDWLKEHVVLGDDYTLETFVENHLGSFNYFITSVWYDNPLPIAGLDLYTQGGRSLLKDFRTYKVYYANEGENTIERCDPDGSNREIILNSSNPSGLSTPHGIMIDPSGGYLYYSEGGFGPRIARVNLEIPNGQTFSNRTDVEVLISSSEASGGDLWLDVHVASGYIVWSSLGNSKIYRAGLNIPIGESHGSRTDIIELATVASPASVAVDDIEDKVYFNRGGGNPTLVRVNLDGTNEETIFTPTETTSWGGLDHDSRNGWLFFINTEGMNNEQFYRINQDGTAQAQLVDLTDQFRTSKGLRFDELNRKIYFTDEQDAIFRMDQDGGNDEQIVFDFAAPDFLVLTDPAGIDLWLLPVPSGGVSLFIGGPTGANNNMTLFTQGPSSAEDSLDLFTIGPRSTSGSLSLYGLGPVQASGAITLVGLRPPLADGELNLYLEGRTQASGNITLYMESPQPVSGGMDLYVANSGIKQTWTGFLKADPLNIVENDIDLIIRGTSTPGAFYLEEDLDLFLKGTADPSESPSSLSTTVFLKVASGILDVFDTWTVFLKASTETIDDVKLFVEGHDGAPSKSGTISFYIESFIDSDSWTLFLKGTPGTQEDISLFMSGVAGASSGTLNMLVSGVASANESIDLILFNEPPSESNDLKLFLLGDPIVKQSPTLKLYTHGAH